MARKRKFTMIDLYQVTKETLVDTGYNGFTFSILAEKLDISRGSIYKYFDNKEELVTEYMVYEMNQFLTELQNINTYHSFEEQFDFLLYIIFKDSSIQKIIGMRAQIQSEGNKKVQANLDKLKELHLSMYSLLADFIQSGKENNIIKPSLQNGAILGFIFQSVAIPNHFNVPKEEWTSSIKEIIQYGTFNKNS
ncbi:TetR/AcrR family transcriptional regulator [Oceanobacillus sp. Castelsardo]|uniref:TetR/AcrR family transcriptional regulator n=1 Tax=Oceanobacillus sp. Castelsardo TaxID=1851204 RepID=UPI0008394CAF|nr:TetR/AcrR family transcriptional regulator [Oceanobacillus sp. Castelsardo]